MNKLLTSALMLCVLAGFAAAQPFKPATQTTFPQWAQNNKKILSYVDWKKNYDQQAARKKAAAADWKKTYDQQIARQKAAAQKAYAAIPKNAKTQAEIVWWNHYNTADGSDIETYQESYTCSVILMDYNEKNGLGTVNVAFKNDCFKLMQKHLLLDWFTFYINLEQFDKLYPEEHFVYEYNNNGDGAVDKNLKIFKHVKIANSDYYQFPMPVRTPSLQNAFKKLFPTPKSFITAEKAALALRLMPGHSGLSSLRQEN